MVLYSKKKEVDTEGGKASLPWGTEYVRSQEVAEGDDNRIFVGNRVGWRPKYKETAEIDVIERDRRERQETDAMKGKRKQSN